MRIIKQPKDFKTLIIYPNLPLMLVPSIAVGIFTSIFKEQGYQVELFETTHYLSDGSSSSEMRAKILNVREFNVKNDLGITIKDDMLGDFRRKVESFSPDFMIFSVVEDAYNQTEQLLNHISDLEIPHLIGGVFPTNAPEICMENPDIEMIGLGEGENSVLEVAEAVRLGIPRNNILGTWYSDEDGVVHKNSKDPLVDINTYQPDFGLFEETRFYRPMGGKVFKMIPVETFRGCPFSCTYCNSPGQRTFSKANELGNFLRRKSMKTLRAEIQDYIKNYKAEFFYFVDDVFLARPVHEILEFCDMYEEFSLPFWFNTRSETCDYDTLTRLKEVGAYRISFGIECGNEEFRQKILRRKISNAELIERFKVIAETGVVFSLNVIIGMPGETRDLVMDTVRLIRSIDGYDALTVSIFSPYHGTVLRDVAVANGWLDDREISNHTTASSILTMPRPYLNSDEIDGLVATFPLYCYFPEDEWDRIRLAETPDDVGLRVREEYSKIYRESFLGETQDSQKVISVVGAAGCRTNPKDAFRISPRRLDEREVDALTINTI
mgnify:CR=1 FL=1